MNDPHPQPNPSGFQSIEERSAISLENGRIYVGHSAGSHLAPAFLFIAGAYHGAWCFNHYLSYFSQRNIGCYALDFPGHGSLPPPEDYVKLGVAELAQSVADASRAIARPLILVGHSMGALPALLAAIQIQPAGMVLLAPSPPGNLPGARALPGVANHRLAPALADDEIRRRFLASGPDDDVTEISLRLTAESPATLNDRYLLRIAIDPGLIHCPGICFEAELDDPDRHPSGQDQAIADFFNFDHQLLKQQPHCMMYGSRWIDSAAAILEWYETTFPVGQPCASA